MREPTYWTLRKFCFNDAIEYCIQQLEEAEDNPVEKNESQD